MSFELFVKANFRPQTTELIDAANKILSEYAAQGFTLTLRQLFYQFVARQLIPNSAELYGRLGRAMVDARRAGLVDWAAIEDRTRGLLGYKSWECPADAVADVAADYAEDLWIDQPRRPEVWVEKSALIGVIEPACGRWRVPHMAARGYPSHSELYATGRRLQRYFAAGVTPIVFYLGDHDPSGLDMARNLREELSLYARQAVEVVSLALNLAQVRELSLPPNPAKQSDKRYATYVLETGQTDCWELDALSPAFIDELLDSAIRGVVENDAWQEAVFAENVNRDLLAETAESVAQEARS